MSDLLNFLPVRKETVASIRARLETDINAGKDPEDQSFWDTMDGTPTADVLMTCALEFERLWDVATTDIPASAFVSSAWGEYLDRFGDELQIERKDAVKATGELTFTGTDGTVIPAGTQVSTEAANIEDEPVVVVTTETGEIGDVISGEVTLPAEALEAGTDGNISAGAAVFLLTPITADTLPSVENTAPFLSGADVESDEAYRDRLLVAYSASRGGGSMDDYRAWALGYDGVGNVRVVPLWLGPGTVRLVITDPENNAASNEVVNGLQAHLDPFSASGTLNGSHTLPDTTIDINESTASFAETGRLLIGENIVTYTGKVSNGFTGCSGGTGTIDDDTPVIQSGEGRGIAPIGAMVTVATTVPLAITVEAELEFEQGYGLDSAEGVIGLRSQIEAAVVTEYIDALPPGGEDPPGLETPPGSGFVIYNRVLSRFFQVEGVYNVTDLEINSGTVDVAVDPLEVPSVTTFTLTEA